MVDCFREQHPDCIAYTYWSMRVNARPKNAGWRLDYMLASQQLRARIHDAAHLPDVMGSDHCPVVLVLKEAAAAAR